MMPSHWCPVLGLRSASWGWRHPVDDSFWFLEGVFGLEGKTRVLFSIPLMNHGQFPAKSGLESRILKFRIICMPPHASSLCCVILHWTGLEIYFLNK